MRLDVPFAAVETNAQRGRYNILRERMLQLVCKYNRVRGSLCLCLCMF